MKEMRGVGVGDKMSLTETPRVKLLLRFRNNISLFHARLDLQLIYSSLIPAETMLLMSQRQVCGETRRHL